MYIKSLRKLTLILLVSLISTLLVSCGGGGGGGETPQIQTQSVEISGKVTINESAPTNTTFNVTANVIDKDGKVISTETTTTALNQQNSQINGSYSLKAGLVSGGKVVITAEAPGYTKATKTIDYQAGSSLTVNLDVKEVVTQTVTVNQGIVINSAGKEYVRIAFFKDQKTGKLMAKTGLQALSADSSEKVLDLAIPLNKLQSGTEQLNVSYKSYTPSNPSDYQDFPGTETTEGDQLVSFGFDYLEITDQEGKNPFVSSQGITAQLVNGEYYRILREVDCVQIRNLIDTGALVDEDPAKEGIQFTFYAFDFDQGGWVTAGQGTFVENSGIDFMNTEWDTIVSSGCDPNSTSTDPTDNSAGCDEYGIITDINNICDGTDMDYVIVSVTNPALEWKNLDYIIPAGSEISCNIKVVDENNKPIAGAYVSANANCMAYVDGMTDSNGNVTLSTIGYSTSCTADVEAWYMMNEGAKTADFNDNCSVTIQISNPYKCTVEGRVVDENNSPVEGMIVWTWTIDHNYTDISATQYYEDFPVSVTDSNGNFSVKTKCNEQGYIYAKFESRMFNVNGTKDNDEISDDGSKVNVGTIQIKNTPPYATLYVDTDPAVGKAIPIELCAYDMEGDYPVSYSIIVKRDGSTVQTFTGQIASTTFCVTHSYTIDTEGTYSVTAELTDSKGKKGYSINDLVGNITTGHYLVGDISASGMRYSWEGFTGVSIWLWGGFEDSDITHNISSNVSYTCYDSGNNPVKSGSATGTDYIEAYDSGTELDNAVYCEFTISANDGGTASFTHTKKINIIDQ
ncbi:hypothetical protein [Persephonella sp.]